MSKAAATAIVVAMVTGCGGGGDAAADPDPGSPSDGSPTSGGSGNSGGAGNVSVAWLAAHNAARAGTLAGVTVTPAPNPVLPGLAWSGSAAAVAQAWANGCEYRHNPDRGADGIARGENIAATAPAGRADVTPGWVVARWGEEWVDYDHATNACAAGKVCGHYTQLVWRSTVRVGCARATCNVNSPFGASHPTWDLFVCNYEPPGNVVGQKPY